MPCSTPRTFTSIMRFHSSSLKRSSGESGMMPALFTSTSMRPCEAMANFTSACMSSSFVTSAARKIALCPAGVGAALAAVGFTALRETPRPLDSGTRPPSDLYRPPRDARGAKG
jgi:hypothetical protein